MLLQCCMLFKVWGCMACLPRSEPTMVEKTLRCEEWCLMNTTNGTIVSLIEVQLIMNALRDYGAMYTDLLLRLLGIFSELSKCRATSTIQIKWTYTVCITSLYPEYSRPYHHLWKVEVTTPYPLKAIRHHINYLLRGCFHIHILAILILILT